jgi:hypothetical protein
MNNELQKLKEIVEGEGFSKDDREYVQSLEDQLHNVVAIEKLGEHPAITAYVEFLIKQKADCKEMLATDQSLGEQARTRLFEQIRQIEHFLGIFDTQRDIVEQQIKGTLEEANAR